MNATLHYHFLLLSIFSLMAPCLLVGYDNPDRNIITFNNPKTATGVQKNNSKDTKLFMAPAAHHKRKNKKQHTLWKEHKTLTTMSFDELQEAKNRLVAAHEKETAIKYIEQMLKMCQDINQTGNLLIELADLYFDCSKLEKAETLYTNFSHLYPGDAKIEYALYKAILCSFHATSDAERDQTKTEATIALADNFLARADIFTTYTTEIEKIREQCYQKIVDSEINIYHFYLNKGSVKAAESRLDTIRTLWLPKIPTIESRLLALEGELTGNQQYLAYAAQKKTDSSDKSLPLIAQAKQPASFITRF